MGTKFRVIHQKAEAFRARPGVIKAQSDDREQRGFQDDQQIVHRFPIEIHTEIDRTWLTLRCHFIVFCHFGNPSEMDERILIQL